MKVVQTWLVAALCCIGVNLMAQTSSYSTQAITKDLNYFTDWTASALVQGFKSKQLKEFRSPLMKQLATEMMEGKYQTNYLLNNYKPVASIKCWKNR